MTDDRARRSSCSRRSRSQEVEIAPGLAPPRDLHDARAADAALARPGRRRRRRSSRAAAAWAACSVRPTASTTTSACGSPAHGIGTMRVGYRKPNDLARCVHDVAAAADLAGRRGARAVRHDGPLVRRRGRDPDRRGARRRTAGASSRSRPSRPAARSRAELGDTPLLLFHGTADEILPPETSAVVQMLAGPRRDRAAPGRRSPAQRSRRRAARAPRRMDPRAARRRSRRRR